MAPMNGMMGTWDLMSVPINGSAADYELTTLSELFTPTPYHYSYDRFGFITVGIDYSRFVDLVAPAIAFTAIFSLLRYAFKNLVVSWLASTLGLKGNVVHKFGYQLWLFFFYLVSSIYGLIVVWNKPWVAFPLGIEQMVNMVGNHPFTDDADLLMYYGYEIGFFLAELVAIFVETKRSDFLQYLAHHIITLYLVIFSWVGYETRIGSYVLIIHDIGDIFLSLAKVLHYLKIRWEFITNSVFAGFVACFLFFRMYCLPLVTKAIFAVSFKIRGPSINYWLMSLGISVLLQGLHVFWGVLIAQMIWRLLTGGTGDVRSDDDEAEDGKKGAAKRSTAADKKKKRAARKEE